MISVAIVLSLALTGCTSERDQARNNALQAYGERLPTIEKAMSQVVSISTSPSEAAAKIAAGDMNVSYNFPTPLPPDATLPGPQFVIIRNTLANATSVQFDVAVGSSGESGGGWTYSSTSVYTCLRFSSEVPGNGLISIVDAPCPSEIQALIDAKPGFEKVTAKDIPYLANRAPAGSFLPHPTQSERLSVHPHTVGATYYAAALTAALHGFYP
jgi:hypothetical protein